MSTPAAIAGVGAALATAGGRGEGTQGRRFTLAAERVLAALEASAARPELVRELRALAPSAPQFSVLLAANGQASLQAGSRTWPLPSAAGEALLRLLQASEPVQARPALSESVSTAPSFMGRLLAAALGAGPRLAGSRAPTVFGQRALLEPEPGRAIDTLGVAGRLRYTLEMSGLFYEAHLKQWVRGQRSESSLREELARMSASPRTALDAEWTSPVPGGAERVAAQLALVEREALSLALPAWSGQRLDLSIESDARGVESAASAPVHLARLALELPRLGRVEAVLRLSGGTLAIELESDASGLESELASLAEQLEARGLKAAALSVRSPRKGGA